MLKVANPQLPIGVHRDGGMSEFAPVPRAKVIPIPNGVSDLAAAMAEPYSVAANVLLRTGAVASDVALIYGAGVVGLTTLQVCAMRGIRCILVDIEDARLERAAMLGAARTINSRREDLEAIVLEETGGYGVTQVVDGAGAPRILKQAVRLAGPTGRIAVMIFAPSTSAIPQQEITKKELSLLGSRLNRRLIPAVLGWLAAAPGASTSKSADQVTTDFLTISYQDISIAQKIASFQLIGHRLFTAGSCSLR